MLNQVNSFNELRVLDIGCNIGDLLDEISSRTQLQARLKRYVGLDAATDAIKIAKSNHPQYTFVLADALQESTYNSSVIPNDNNIIVCSGLCDYLSPKNIKLLLSLLEKKLSTKPSSRIYINYPTTRPTYGLFSENDLCFIDQFYAEYDQYYGGSVFVEDEIRGIVYGKNPHFFKYKPDEFNKMIENANFEIERANSISNLPYVPLGTQPHSGKRTYDCLCIKRSN